MQIRRVSVPSFRLLRDVELVLVPQRDRQIFSLGPDCGSGQSLLLRLIFGLLHCSAVPERREYLRRVLDGFDHDPEEPEKRVAEFAIEFDDVRVVLEFASLGPAFARSALGDMVETDFAGFLRDSGAEARARQRLAHLEDLVPQLDSLRVSLLADESPGPRAALYDEVRRLLGREALLTLTPRELVRHARHERNLAAASLRMIRGSRVPDVERVDMRLADVLTDRGMVPITPFGAGPPDTPRRPRLLVCRSRQHGPDELLRLLRRAGRRISLLGLSAQHPQFIGATGGRGAYDDPALERRLSDTPPALTAFCAYDSFVPEPLVDLFRAARDRDFRTAVERGAYGQDFETVCREADGLLVGKRVRPLADLTGLRFSTACQSPVVLRPADLSPRERQRLMVYAWLKGRSEGDEVVLIDDLDPALEAGGRRGLDVGLPVWAPGHQYLLARDEAASQARVLPETQPPPQLPARRSSSAPRITAPVSTLSVNARSQRGESGR